MLTGFNQLGNSVNINVGNDKIKHIPKCNGQSVCTAPEQPMQLIICLVNVSGYPQSAT